MLGEDEMSEEEFAYMFERLPVEMQIELIEKMEELLNKSKE